MGENVLKFGDVVLVEVPFTDQNEIKLRPAMVLFQELNNVVIVGITSNVKMKGILISKEEGLVKNSVLKLNYIFTTDRKKIRVKVTRLSEKLLMKICQKMITEKLDFCVEKFFK